MKQQKEEKIRIQLNVLLQALSRLEETLKLNPTRIHKDATIQRFEFCFELAWKLLQSVVRYQGVEVFGPRNTIRSAAQLSFIKDPKRWIETLEARNLTTHVYSGEIADEVYKQARKFYSDAQSMIPEVQKLFNNSENKKDC